MNMKLFYHMLSTNGGVSQTKIDSFRIDLISFHLMFVFVVFVCLVPGLAGQWRQETSTDLLGHTNFFSIGRFPLVRGNLLNEKWWV